MGYHAINRDTITIDRVNRAITNTLISTPGVLHRFNVCLSSNRHGDFASAIPAHSPPVLFSALRILLILWSTFFTRKFGISEQNRLQLTRHSENSRKFGISKHDRFFARVVPRHELVNCLPFCAPEVACTYLIVRVMEECLISYTGFFLWGLYGGKMSAFSGNNGHNG